MHRFAEGRDLILGGVKIPHHAGLLGHSDADVLSHAIADALLGAVAAGDVGRHFPDTDPAWRGASSLDILRRVVAIVRGEGVVRIVNVDSTVVAQEPRLAPHVDAMRSNLEEALSVPAASVSVKATTSERLGALGRLEGMAAMASALVEVAS